MHWNGSIVAALICKGGNGVPMSCGLTENGKHRGEH
jgi:hypothetical protein